MEIIELRAIKKIIGDTNIISNLDLKIYHNEILAILGKNGAGKSTLMKMLSLQSRPTSGKIFFRGYPIDGNEKFVKSLIGIVPQHLNLDTDLTVEENLELHCRLYNLDKFKRRVKINNFLEMVDLQQKRQAFIRELSGGMKQRLMIIRALLHDPKILLLDEPTVALDLQIRRKFWLLMEELKKQGLTIVLTTHYLERLESLCDRIAILEKGKLRTVTTPEKICVNKLFILSEDAS